MRTNPLAAAFFAAVFAAVIIPAGASPAGAKARAGVIVNETAAKVERMKSVLFNLVRQDETLDGVIDKFNSSGSKLSAHEISTLGLTLKTVKGGLDAGSARNKKSFSEARPDAALSVYTRTILSYSHSISRKTAKIGALLAHAALTSKKTAMRDAVSSKNSGRIQNGKKLTQILEEQQALERLSADLQALKASSRKLTATSKWLDIVSK
ncbi:MAG: hypothetical protein A2X28_07315 [Elusimicrobia bacterium GWA2_56_46]|jgi:hypothetical protein|nr:MAG: hypothetical protein A2X28_07315 [Elusimicrobia bacterium GWA2_56_46]OGR54747.1 MAG: hypothetical protein A2X39_10675 [Elusimicrobia bacterium GWC2_56_31]HBB67990.1 hypothetical protein [Elusimicrobiota bacterium]HBW23463.1 hypothetical protein [Elusimicrobiota bacterium]